MSISDLAASLKEFMRFLDTDPVIRELAKAQPAQWQELKSALVKNQYVTYYLRWRDIYKNRLSVLEWVRAAFAMPFMPWYYRNVAGVLREEAKVQMMRLFGIHDPATKEVGYFERRDR